MLDLWSNYVKDVYMIWKFDGLTPNEKMVLNMFTIEGGISAWIKRFAEQRKISKSHAVRGLVTEAVSYWLKTKQSLARRQEYPFAVFEGRGLHTQEIGVKLDANVLEGLREISQITGKSVSRVVSEILLDAKNASAEIATAHARAGEKIRVTV
jgi:hypothetical protein